MKEEDLIFFQCHYVSMLKYLSGQILVLISLHHYNFHGPYSPCSNVWVFLICCFIFFWNFHFYFSSVTFVTLLLSCLLLVHFYFPGAPVMFRASIPLIYSQPLWITLQDRPVRFLSFPPPNFNVSGKRMVSVGFGVCCAQSADVPLWGKAMSCALILSTAEARVWYWTNSLSALH